LPQDDLAAVKAAGVLSKSGTMRFEIGGALLGSMPASSSRPSTAEGPDEQYRLSKQVRTRRSPTHHPNLSLGLTQVLLWLFSPAEVRE
jgi:hypothetical protein